MNPQSCAKCSVRLPIGELLSLRFYFYALDRDANEEESPRVKDSLLVCPECVVRVSDFLKQKEIPLVHGEVEDCGKA